MSVSGRICAICLDGFEEASRLDVCTHIYCFDCIARWSESSDKCPQCNATFGVVTSLIDESHMHTVCVKPRGPSDEPVDDPGELIELSGDDSDRTTDEELLHYNGYRDDGFMARDDEIEYSSDSEIGAGGVSLRISMVDMPPSVEAQTDVAVTASDDDSDRESLRSYWNRRRREVAAERRRRTRQREQRRERQARRERAPVVVDLTADSDNDEPPTRKRLRRGRRRSTQRSV